jgi:cell division transport system permease protein
MARSGAGARTEGAVASRAGPLNRFSAWLRHHRLSSADSLQRLLDKPWSSLLTWMVIAIAMALPVGLNVALENVRSASTGLDRPAQVSVFLRSDMDGAAARQFQAQLSSDVEIVETQLISAEEALEEFRALSGFGDLLDTLDENPLPSLIIVSPAADLPANGIVQLQGKLQAMPEVEQAVLDMEWVQRLASLMSLGRRIVYAVGALLVLGVILILGNTIRLAIESRRDEIVIVKLVGGSNAFVRRPFLYTGLWYGVGGGLFAAILVTASLWFTAGPAHALAQLYSSGFEVRGLGVMGGLNLIVLGGLLGLTGAWVAVSRHLSAIEPR